MARHEITLQAFVSSPNGVSEERVMLEDVVRELNVTWSKTLGMRIELVKWETHATPGVGQDPQQVINSQIGDEYDIFIGIMWVHFGTETGRFGSGTEEEFERAYTRYLKEPNSVEIMFYFKDAGVQPSEVDLEQLGRVLAFKKKLGPKGALYGTYKTREEFTQHLRLHLSRVVQNWKAKHSVTAVPKCDSMALAKADKKSISPDGETMDEVGFLDVIETGQDRFEKLTQITIRMTEAINDLGEKIHKRGEQVKAATNSVGTPTGIDLKAAKRATDSLAEDMETFVARMEVEIPLYSEASKSGIESWAHAANLLSDFNPNTEEEIEQGLVAIRTMMTGLLQARDGNSIFIGIVASMPRVTSAFNKARRHTITVLEKLGNEVNATINLISEVEKLFLDLLEKNRGTLETKPHQDV